MLGVVGTDLGVTIWPVLSIDSLSLPWTSKLLLLFLGLVSGEARAHFLSVSRNRVLGEWLWVGEA